MKNPFKKRNAVKQEEPEVAPMPHNNKAEQEEPEAQEISAHLLPIYTRYKELNLQATSGLTAMAAVFELVDIMNKDEELLGLAADLENAGIWTGGRGIHYLGRASLCLDKEGIYIFVDEYGDGNPMGVDLIRDIQAIRTRLTNYNSNPPPSFELSEASLKTAILEYITDASSKKLS